MADQKQKSAQKGVSSMENEQFSDFDAADYLKTEEAIEAYLRGARIGGDAGHVARAEETAKRARARLDAVNKQ